MSLVFKDGRVNKAPVGAIPHKGFDGSVHGYAVPRPSPAAPPSAAGPAAPPSPAQGMTLTFPKLVPDMPQQADGQAPIPPFIATSTPGGMTMMVPNPRFGQAYGMEWDGRRWVRIDPNRDLERKMLEMQLEQRRQQMQAETAKTAHEQEMRARELRMIDSAMQQQGATAVTQNEQRPWRYAPGRPGNVEFMDPREAPQQDARRRQIAIEQENAMKTQLQNQENHRRSLGANPGAAQPIEPPSQGTPYGKSASAFGFKPPPPGSSNYAVMEWWHNPANGEETQATAGSIAPPGWVKGRLSEAPPSAPAMGVSQFGVRAHNDPSNPRGPGAPPPNPILTAPNRPNLPVVY